MKFSREQIDEILTDPKYQLLAEGIKKLKNINGYTPQKGVDFFTEKDVEDISDYIEKSGRNIKITNDVTGFVEKVIKKIKVENNTDLTPLLKSLEKIYTKLSEKPTSEKDTEIDYTEILTEIKKAIPQGKENPLIQDISDTLNEFVTRFDKLLTENNRLRVEVDRIGGGGGGGGVLPKGVLNARNVQINPATEETLQTLATETTLQSLLDITTTGRAIIDPRAGYGFNDQDEAGPTYKYYGFQNASGAWYFVRLTIADSAVRYAKGASAYATAWTNRASQTYDTFDNTFDPVAGSVITSATDINTVVNNDFAIDLALGNITGKAVRTIYGRNPDIDAASGFETVWNGGGVYSGQNATGAELVTLVSNSLNDTSAGTGARTIKIFGLSGAGVEQSETVTLNGLTPVDSTLTYLRMWRATVMTAGSVGSNVGTITCAQKVTTTNVFFKMPTGNNHTAVCAYTIPAGKRGLLKTIEGGVISPNTANTTFKLFVRQPGEVWQVEQIGASTSSSALLQEWMYFKDEVLEPLADIRIDVDTDANNTEVSASFCIILVDI